MLKETIAELKEELRRLEECSPSKRSFTTSSRPSTALPSPPPSPAVQPPVWSTAFRRVALVDSLPTYTASLEGSDDDGGVGVEELPLSPRSLPQSPPLPLPPSPSPPPQPLVPLPLAPWGVAQAPPVVVPHLMSDTACPPACMSPLTPVVGVSQVAVPGLVSAVDVAHVGVVVEPARVGRLFGAGTETTGGGVAGAPQSPLAAWVVLGAAPAPLSLSARVSSIAVEPPRTPHPEVLHDGEGRGSPPASIDGGPPPVGDGVADAPPAVPDAVPPAVEELCCDADAAVAPMPPRLAPPPPPPPRAPSYPSRVAAAVARSSTPDPPPSAAESESDDDDDDDDWPPPPPVPGVVARIQALQDIARRHPRVSSSIASLQAVHRGSVLRQSLTKEQRLLRTHDAQLNELWATERAYHDALKLCVSKYLAPLRDMASTGRQGIDLEVMVEPLFGNIEILASSSEVLLALSSVFSGSLQALEVFLPLTALYNSYMENKHQAQAIVDKCSKDKLPRSSKWRPLAAFFKTNTRSLAELDSLLIRPVQRVLRYRLVVRELVSSLKKLASCAAPTMLSADVRSRLPSYEATLSALSHVADDMNECKRRSDTRAHLRSVTRSLKAKQAVAAAGASICDGFFFLLPAAHRRHLWGGQGDGVRGCFADGDGSRRGQHTVEVSVFNDGVLLLGERGVVNRELSPEEVAALSIDEDVALKRAQSAAATCDYVPVPCVELGTCGRCGSLQVFTLGLDGPPLEVRLPVTGVDMAISAKGDAATLVAQGRQLLQDRGVTDVSLAAVDTCNTQLASMALQRFQTEMATKEALGSAIVRLRRLDAGGDTGTVREVCGDVLQLAVGLKDINAAIWEANKVLEALGTTAFVSSDVAALGRDRRLDWHLLLKQRLAGQEQESRSGLRRLLSAGRRMTSTPTQRAAGRRAALAAPSSPSLKHTLSEPALPVHALRSPVLGSL